MRKYLILLICPVILFCLLVISFADSTLIEGNSDSMPILLNTRCLDGKPVLIFTEELGETDADFLNKIDNITFYDNDWKDLVIELSNPIQISDSDSIIEVIKEDIYELWLDTSALSGKEGLTRWRVKVDKDETGGDFRPSERKYVNVGEWRLKKGRHRIRIIGETAGAKDIWQLKSILVDKKRKEIIEAEVWEKINKPQTENVYIFSRPKGDFIVNHQKAKTYSLKVRLRPKVFESEVPWENKSNVNWKSEANLWKLGLLEDENIQPVIINEEINLRRDCKEKRGIRVIQESRITVFNPSIAKMKTSFKFLVNPARIKVDLAIRLNNNLEKTVSLPQKNGFIDVDTGLLLMPGKNEIKLSCSAKFSRFQKMVRFLSVTTRKSGIKFRDFELQYIGKATDGKSYPSTKAPIFKPSIDSLDIIFYDDSPVVLSRDVEVNLEEFPFFDLESEFYKTATGIVIPLFGVDYTGDGVVEGYLKANEMGVHNLLKLAKLKWKEADKNGRTFVLRKIILLASAASQQGWKEKDSIIFRLKRVVLFNDLSMVLVNESSFSNKLQFEEINSQAYITEKKGVINILGSFKSLSMKGEKNELEKEPSGVNIRVPLEDKPLKDFPYFSFDYETGNPEYYSIELGILIKARGKGGVIKLKANQYKIAEKDVEVDLREIGYDVREIKGLVIMLTKTKEDAKTFPLPSLFRFRISNLQLYNKFPYPFKSNRLKDEFLSLLAKIKPFLKIDDSSLSSKDFDLKEIFNDAEANVASGRVDLARGIHNYEVLENSAFDIEWLILEPEEVEGKTTNTKGPQITFQRINPAKYLVKVKDAKEPFWLIFSERFDSQWRLYNLKAGLKKFFIPDSPSSFLSSDVIKDYPDLRLRELGYRSLFAPNDVKFLFKIPLAASHYKVNGYANGWFIEPSKSGLGSDFVLTIYFLPQSLFYLGLFVSAIAVFTCVFWLLINSFKKHYSKARLKRERQGL